MSYILDALKKSETERSRGAAPSLIGAVPTAPRHGRIVALLAAALFVNAVLAGGWLFWPRAETPAATAQAAADAPAARPAREHATEPALPVVATEPARLADAAIVEPAPARTIDAAPATPVGLDSLRPDELRAFDGLDFSAHVFADDATLRAVTLNGRRFKEGDALSSTLLLQHITEDGVVIRYGERLVELPVLQDWRI